MNMFMTKPRKHWLQIFLVWQLQVKAVCTSTLAFVVASRSSKETKLEKIHGCFSKRKPFTRNGWQRYSLQPHKISCQTLNWVAFVKMIFWCQMFSIFLLSLHSYPFRIFGYSYTSISHECCISLPQPSLLW